MAELESENRKMREPLEAARKEMEELRRRAENYEKIKTLYEVYIPLEHKFCTFFVHQQRTEAHKVKLLVRSGVDAEFYGESFGNKT
jgi:hypothetical protein